MSELNTNLTTVNNKLDYNFGKVGTTKTVYINNTIPINVWGDQLKVYNSAADYQGQFRKNGFHDGNFPKPFMANDAFAPYVLNDWTWKTYTNAPASDTYFANSKEKQQFPNWASDPSHWQNDGFSDTKETDLVQYITRLKFPTSDLGYGTNNSSDFLNTNIIKSVKGYIRIDNKSSGKPDNYFTTLLVRAVF